MAYILSHLLTHSAVRYADNIAVVHEQHQYTYQALDEMSNRFAHLLYDAGVRRGDRVGLYLKKSLEAVAALFGILKLGAAYVPLDLSAPVQRVAYMVANCVMKAIISTKAKYSALQAPLTRLGHLPSALLIDDPAALAAASLVAPPDPGTILYFIHLRLNR